MNRLPDQPLSNEERRLAEQLGRLGPHAGPSPSLDARILASARAAVAAPSLQARKPRWPVGLGIAASALLAVGIAWQLRPLDESPQLSEAPDVAVQASQPAATAVEPATESVGHPDVPYAPPPPPPVKVLAPPIRQLTGDTTGKAMPAPPEAPPIEISEARPTDAYTPPPPPAPVMSAPAYAPAPAAAPPQISEAASARDEETAASEQRAAQRQGYSSAKQTADSQKAESERHRNAAKRASDDASLDRVIVTGSAPAPAASAFESDLLSLSVSDDATLVPVAWLQRIRDRQQQGDRDGAIESLRLLHDTYPDQPLPSDLQGLLGE